MPSYIFYCHIELTLPYEAPTSSVSELVRLLVKQIFEPLQDRNGLTCQTISIWFSQSRILPVFHGFSRKSLLKKRF